MEFPEYVISRGGRERLERDIFERPKDPARRLATVQLMGKYSALNVFAKDGIRYSKQEQNVVRDLTCWILDAEPWGSLSTNLRKSYGSGDLAAVAPKLSVLLKHPGALGHYVFDPTVFENCRIACNAVAQARLKPACVRETTGCYSCVFNRGKTCSAFGRPFFGKSGIPLRDEVLRQTNELLAQKLIPVGAATRAIAAVANDPLEGLRIAVLSIQNDLSRLAKSDLTQFGEEPEESKEVKAIFSGPEMQVEIGEDPSELFKKADSGEPLSRSAGVDQWLL